MVAKTIRTGRPGRLDKYAEKERELGRLQRGGFASELPEIFRKDGPAEKTGQGIRRYQEAISPQLKKTQTQQAESLQALLASQDPTKLSGSEMANIERGLGRMGLGVGRTSNMDVIGASHQFSDALAQKQQRLAQALAQTAPVASSFKSGVNPGLIEGQQGMAGTQVQNVPGQMTFGTTTPYEALQQTAATTRSSNQGTSGGQAVYDQLFPPKPRG